MNGDYAKSVFDAASSEAPDSSVDELALAMAYVPIQQWRKLYEPPVGFNRGTIFSELDLPFIGEAACNDE